jgi:purine-binding chemotaxis protein CheW
VSGRSLSYSPLGGSSEPNAEDAVRGLLVFQLAERSMALPLTDVERITPIAELLRPPGLPQALEGILNLAGVAVPVLRLDRLFALPPQRLGLYSILIVLRTPLEDSIAVLADRVNEILWMPESAFLPIAPGDSFNGFAEAAVAHKDGVIHVLSLTRMLLAKEEKALAAFQAMAQQRIQDWETGPV